MSSHSFSFTHALCRKPGTSITNGLRAKDIGQPNLEIFLRHHADYVSALRSTGAQVTVLEPLEEFPDSVFIEDDALCLPQGVIVMRPGATSRFGETAKLTPKLSGFYDNVLNIEGPGFIEGGDILTTQREILVGLSARTDLAGVDELRQLVNPWGYSVRVVNTPKDILHFKTDCSLLDEETILSTKKLAASGCFSEYKVIHTAHGEDACANAIRFNNLVLIPDGFPKTAEKLDKAGYEIRQIGNSEAAKLDGGMSCLSLRFSPNSSHK